MLKASSLSRYNYVDCCPKYALKQLCFLHEIGDLSFSEQRKIFTSLAANRDQAEKTLCAHVGQSSRLINESNANQIIEQTGTNCFSCKDIIHCQSCAIKPLNTCSAL